MTQIFTYYNLLLGVLSSAGLVYLLYKQTFVVEVKRFLVLTTIGMLVFAVGGPLAALVLPEIVHLIHGTAAALVVLGLYNPIKNDLRAEEWAELLLQDPTVMRHPAEWMVPMDDEILQLFHSSELILTPAIIAYNIGYSREEVNRRLSELTERNLVERIERGKYRIAQYGEMYLKGTLHSELLKESNDA